MIDRRKSRGHTLSVTGGVTLGLGVLAFALVWFNIISTSCTFITAMQLLLSVLLFMAGAVLLLVGLLRRARTAAA